MTPRTIIFDLDGTISDPSEGISKCVNHALTYYGYTAVSSSAVCKMIGPPLTEIFEHFLGSLDEDRMLGLVARYRERYADIGYRENIIYEHIAELIHKLAASGFVLGVCTSKRADYAERIIEMFGLGPCFSFIDGGDIHIKKYMQLEQLVAAGLDAASTVMVGDRGVDIEAARLNAIQSVGVSWGFAHRNELQEAGADHIANNPLELGKLFL